MYSFYHVGPDYHQIGDIIYPTFGPEYNQYDPAQDWITCGHNDQSTTNYHHSFGRWLMLSREMVFENVRLTEFPGKPSRFKSVYACPTLPTMSEYLITTKKQYYKTIYKVTMVEPDSPVHYGDHSICFWKPGMKLPDVVGAAQRYWEGCCNPSEVITTSPFIIDDIVTKNVDLSPVPKR